MFAEDPFNVEIKDVVEKCKGNFVIVWGEKTCKCLLNPGILES